MDWLDEQTQTTVISSVAQLAEALQFRSNDWQPDEEEDGVPGGGDIGVGSTLVWRGVSNRAYPLHSTLYRRLMVSTLVSPAEVDVAKAESELLYRARKNLHGFRNGSKLTDLELLAVLQHYGAATRLVDVTRNILVALWFATTPTSLPDGKEADGVLFGVDVTGRTIPRSIERQSVQNLARRAGVWHWEPPPLEQRMRAQQGSFIFSRTRLVASAASGRELTSLDLNPLELEELRQRLFTRRPQKSASRLPAMIIFVIPGFSKSSMRADLGTFYGQDEQAIFPDLAGFAQSWGVKR